MDLDSDQVKFNEALETYQQKYFEKTDELLSQMDKDLSIDLERKTLILKGHNAFHMSDNFLNSPGESENALKNIEKSIGYYKRILQLDHGNEGISNNLELAMLKREVILSKKAEEDQQQQENQTTNEQLDELQKKQEELADDTQKGADDHQSSQENVRKETSELNESMSPDTADVSEQLQKAENYQEEALEALEDKDFEKANSLQEKAAEALKEASEKLNGESHDKPSEQSDGADESENESDQIAKSIIENENNRETSSDTTGEGFTVDRNW